jgi:hypothetical protein
MNQKFRFDGGEIVRLVRDVDGVPAGACGVLWGVYDFDPPLYEADFVFANDEVSLTFNEDDVEEVADVSQAPYSERLQGMLRSLSRRDEK